MIETRKLAKTICAEVKKEFSHKRLSGNLANTTKVKTNYGRTVSVRGRWQNIISVGSSYSVLIEAPEYNIYDYLTKKERPINPLGTGYSYASEVDRKGGFCPIRKGAKSKKRGRLAQRGNMWGVFTGNHTGYIMKSINNGIKKFSANIGENVEIKYY